MLLISTSLLADQRLAVYVTRILHLQDGTVSMQRFVGPASTMSEAQAIRKKATPPASGIETPQQAAIDGTSSPNPEISELFRNHGPQGSAA